MIPSEFADVEQKVHTGSLPRWERVQEHVREAHQRYAGRGEGRIADYIPALGAVDGTLFGLAVAATDGGVHEVGDVEHQFSIQSISKLFTFALAIAEHGHGPVRDRVGVNNTGLSFDSLMALELNDGHPMNPMVNAGAIVVTAMAPGSSLSEKWDSIHRGLSAFAGRQLVLDEEIYRSESETNLRNRAMATLLRSYGRLDDDPLGVVDVYTRQCSLSVTAHDLAIMGATLADGGVNPVTGERVVSAEVCRDTLAVVASSGLYENSGEWLFEIGLPAKSGVSGGLVAVAPGKGAIGAFSPPLDQAGNSVRSQLAIGHLSRTLGLNMFASAPAVTERS